MNVNNISYDLPQDLIAQYPIPKRENSRLMVVDRNSQRFQHGHFYDLPNFLSPEDLLVVNNTRVFPARLYAQREGSSGRLEVFLLRRLEKNVWDALIRPAKKVQPGTRIFFGKSGVHGEILESPLAAVTRRIRFEYQGDFSTWVEKLGTVPLPPYIKRPPQSEDRERYQTIFSRISGSVAAPTAGLHFSKNLLQKIRHCQITLHVGYGTFKPILEHRVEQHLMEPEYYDINLEAAQCIRKQLRLQQRVVAVGTTTTRTLEHVFLKREGIRTDCGWTNLFIYPGFKFHTVSALITNFHLPRSTLLLLVAAFAGRELILQAYREAVREKYRFYSYGDAMLIL